MSSSSGTVPIHRTTRSIRLRWAAIAASAFLIVGAASCSSDGGAAESSSTTAKKTTTSAQVENVGDAPIDNAITITAPGMSFEVSGELRPGIGAITFKNTDDVSHMLAVTRVKDGVTLDQIRSAAGSSEESATALMADGPDADYGTPSPVGPGQQSTVIAKDLKPGTYAILCFFVGDDGTPHFQMGMVNEFTVTGDPATDAPKSDGTITVDDKAFTMPDGFNGKGTFEVTNTGTKAHDLQLVKLDPGTTLQSYFGAVGEAMNTNKSVDNAKGGVMMGGVDGLSAGQSAWIVLDLPAGHYGYLSIGDAQAGPPAQIGEFTIS